MAGKRMLSDSVVPNTSSASLMLSVSLIMLAFFIYLSSIVQPSSATHLSTVQSLRTRFQGTQTSVPPSAPDAFQEMSDKLKAIFPSSSLVLSGTEKAIDLTIPQHILVLTEGGSLRASSLAALSQLISLIKDSPFQIEIDALTLSEPAQQQSVAQSLSALSRFFIDKGLAPERIQFFIQPSPTVHAADSVIIRLRKTAEQKPL